MAEGFEVVTDKMLGLRDGFLLVDGREKRIPKNNNIISVLFIKSTPGYPASYYHRL